MSPRDSRPSRELGPGGSESEVKRRRGRRRAAAAVAAIKSEQSAGETRENERAREKACYVVQPQR